MLLALALHGCDLDRPPTVVHAVPPEEPAAELGIATAPDRSAVVRAEVIEAPLPSGQPILRSCFGESKEDPSSWGILRGGAKGGAATGAAPAQTATPSPTPPPTSSPVASPRPPARKTASKPAEAPPPPPPAGAVPPVQSAPATDSSVKGDGRGAAPASAPAMEPIGGEVAASKPKARLEQEKRERSAGLEDEESPPFELSRGEDVARTPTPQFDWGATVWLSNDDSMSLASAQRVLYAMSRGVGLSPSEIRPHELLNYFSFDSVVPPPGQTFGVLGGAEQDGDTLTVSLAVRGANPARQPLDLTVLLDRSCSMAAEGRMSYTQRGLGLLSDRLQRGDRIDVVLFDTGVCTPLENFVVGRDDPELLQSVIRKLAPTGSTNLDAGLHEAYRIQTSREPGDTHGRNRRVLLLTDAELNAGNVSEALVSEVGKQLDQHDIRLSGIGVGREFNDRMLDLLTEKGRGAYVYLGSEAVVDRIFGLGFDSLVRTVAHDVQFSLDLPDSLAMERFYGEETSTVKADVDPIHYHAGTTQLFLQDLKIRGGQAVRTDPLVMRIEWRDAATMEPQTQELRTTVGALLDADPHNLRKGRALMAFADLVTAKAMGASPCGAPLAAYRERASAVADDAEIGFVNGLVGQTCGIDLATVVPRGVELKLRVDSDIPIGEVELACAGQSLRERLSAADTVARFASVQPGSCTVWLDGTTPMAARVEVPETGADLRCIIRGGRISCG